MQEEDSALMLSTTATVEHENMEVVRATSPHLMFPIERLVELSNALIHRKYRIMTIPGAMDQTNEVSADR